MEHDALNEHVRLARERTATALQLAGAQALVASSPANIQYLTGYRSFFHNMHIVNQSFVLLTPEGKCVLVVPSSDGDFVAMGGFSADEVQTYGTFYVEPADGGAVLTDHEVPFASLAASMVNKMTWVQGLQSALEAEGIAKVVVAVDQGHLMPSFWQQIQAALPQAKLLDAFPLMQRVRAVKTPFEIELLRRSSSCSEAAIQNALKVAAHGATDLEIRDAFEKSLIDSGADHLFSAIAVGSRTSLPNVLPNGTRLRPGGLVRFDAGCYYRGYASDLARNATLGRAPQKVRHLYHAMCVGEEAALAAMRPGIQACQVFDAAVQGVRKSGVPQYRRHHCGHAIGLEMYEPPIIRRDDTTPLEEGMTFCIETPYYELGFGGIQVEDMLVVRADGPELLTALSRQLFELVQ
jgi:Xaa-Pro dipeptidase